MTRPCPYLLSAGIFFGLAIGNLCDARPPLPIPCIAGNCGTSAQQFVSYGKAGAAASGSKLTVTQSSANAILNWADFNIASGYKVTFVQPSATSAVLNNIWSADPSVIAGSMSANGQVYLYNQNGIVFDKGAQINVGALTASTLNFAEPTGSTDPEALFKSGILSKNGNAAATGTLPPVFQTSASATNASGYYTCTAGPCGVTVNSGAVLTAADGGRIMLLGQAVSNHGTISTPDGQTILGAGNTVYLAASTDPSLRGLLIEVNTGGADGAVANLGTIAAARGNVTLAGMTVNQAGTISATTSVSANGSIFLVAGDTSGTSSSGQAEGFYNNNAAGFGTLLPNQGGKLTLAPGSVTEVPADSTDTATVSEQNLVNFIPSEVALVGQQVTVAGKVRAPGATVLALAATNPSNQSADTGTANDDGGRIYLASGGSIDVSGLTGVAVAATANVLEVTLEGDDLQDDPLLRDSFLHGATVTVNASQGSTLFNVAPYAADIQLGIRQVLTAAGSIQLNSDGDVIARAGSTLNVSGGSVAYQGAYGPSTTKLRAVNGQVYDIGDAPNDIQYAGIANSYSYTDPTWGTTTSTSSRTYYAGYTQGANAGEVEVLGRQVYLRGAMLANTVAGLYQRTAGTIPQGGFFELGCNCASTTGGADFRAPALLFANGATDTLGAFDYGDLATSLPAALQSTTTLSPSQLAGSGFDRIAIYSNGAPAVSGTTTTATAGSGTPAIYLPAGTSLNLAAGGEFIATTDQSIAIDGNISIAGSPSVVGTAAAGIGARPGGVFSFPSLVGSIGASSISAGASTVQLVTTKESQGDSVSHDIDIGAGAVIDVAGGWINDSPLLLGNLPGNTALAINGGSVTLSADGNVVLGERSRIDVAGGGWVNSANQLSPGNAGAISVSAMFLPLDTGPYAGSVSIGSGTALLGAALEGGTGGALSLSSGSVTVGAAAAGTSGELLLAPSFFNQGFASYSITGQNDVMIGSTTAGAAPISIAPVEQNLVFAQDSYLKPTGTTLSSFTIATTLPPSQRGATDLVFTSTASSSGPDDPATGDVTLAQNASIVAQAGASAGSKVMLAANSGSGNLAVLGSIIAPGGDITLELETSSFVQNPDSGLGYFANQKILLGSDAVLEAAAYPEINTLNPLGYRQGSVLAGGTVSLQANKGYVVTELGSLIDVSGSAAEIDVATSSGMKPTIVAASAGTIDIDAREGIVLQGSLKGEAATFDGSTVAGAAGGTLSIGLDLFDYVATVGNGNNAQLVNPYPLNPRTLTLTSAANYVPSNQLLSGSANIDVATLTAGGFDNIALKSADIIAIDGAVSLSARSSLTLDAPLLHADPGAALRLSSAYVALGNYFNAEDYFDTPTAGAAENPNAVALLTPGCALPCTATLAVSAQLIDVRGISGIDGFASESLVSSGDIRLTNALNPVDTPPPLATPAGDASLASLRSGLAVNGNLTLAAQQIYPTTNTDFTLSSTGVVAIAKSAGTGAPPLSAGGMLTINAPTIVQGGVLRAPMGDITLNAVSSTDPSTGAVSGGSLSLLAGSVTSVSTQGVVIPYGSTVNGEQWTYSPDSLITEVVGAPPSKAINLNGASVSVNKGARVDLSGGGDLYAYEFIAGEGGSQDVLSPTNAATGAYSYAILPTLGSAFAPIDAQYQQGSKAGADQTIYLTGVPGLAAGYYALLPARYALLPGAFAIQIIKSDSGIVAGPAVQQGDGAYIAAGRFGVAGTDVSDSLASTVLVAPASVVRTQSQFTDTYANAYFSGTAAANHTAVPSLPADAGDLQISATTALALDGSINFSVGSYESATTASGSPITAEGARGAVSIVSPNILIVDTAAQASTAVTGTAAGGSVLALSAQSLDSLGAQTLVLGGTVQQTTAGEVITGGSAQSIELDNSNVALTAPEIILAGQSSIALDAGAKVDASGTVSRNSSALLLQGAGALLQASGGAAAPLVVTSATAGGQLSIGAGASVKAGGSLLLYSSGDTTAQPDAVIGAPALGIYSSRVSVGDVPTGPDAPNGLNLTPKLLSDLTGLTALTIGSSSTIDFYGAVNLGTANSANPNLGSITLDAWAVDGYGSGNKTLQAGSITLQNSNTIAPANLYAATPSGTGIFTLDAVSANSAAGEITLGSGSKMLSGFSAVNMRAAGDIESQGNGTLTLRGSGDTPMPLLLQSAALTVASGGSESITTAGSVTVSAPASSSVVLPPPPAAGALSITGSSIAQNGNIDLPSGIVTLEATNGDLVLGKGSKTSAAGAYQSFGVTDAAAGAGRIDLLADAGNVTVAGGARVDVAGVTSPDGKASGAAGSLRVSAPTGTFTYAGSTLEGAAATGESQGNFTLDVARGLAGTGLATLDAALARGGFLGALSLRTRNDSAVTVSGDIVASSYQLGADAGSIRVAGTIDTGGTTAASGEGGAIALWAGTGLTLESSAQLLANAGTTGPVGVNGAAAAGRGGDITLGTASGILELDGGKISMLGTGGTSASDGSLTLRAPRTADGTDVQIAFGGAATTVYSRNPVIVEGVRSYSATSLGSVDAGCGTGGSCDVADLGGILFTDAATFAANAAAITSRLAAGISNGLAPSTAMALQVRSGIEIDSSGDLVLGDGNTAAWDLDSWNAALGAPVNLTLRAAGNLFLNASLSDGFTNNFDVVANWVFGESAGNVDSATYRLTGGADLTAADPLAVVRQPVFNAGGVPNSGNVILAPGNLIRTGDGSIAIAAGGDVMLGYSADYAADGSLEASAANPLNAVIYTAGLPSPVPDAALFTAPSGSSRNRFTAAYPEDGGSISVSAGDDMLSAPSAQLASDWQWRQGAVDAATGLLIAPNKNTSWWIVFNDFDQGIGALGGGDVSLSAGGNIVNVSAVVATTGELLGAAGTVPSSANLVVNGAGNLSVQARGNIESGVFQDDWGNGSIQAGGGLTAGTTLGAELPTISQDNIAVPLATLIYPILSVGAGTFDVSARDGITINSVVNGTTLPESAANSQVNRLGSYYFTFASNSTLNILSAGGDVVLQNASEVLPQSQLNVENSALPNLYAVGSFGVYYPPVVNVTSLTGNIELLDTGLNLFPSAGGNLSLLAQGSITGVSPTNPTGFFAVSMYETDPGSWPNVLAPQAGATAPAAADLPLAPLYQSETQPVYIVANTGSISASDVTLTKAAYIIAGEDITDLDFVGKNLNPSDVTLIEAGGTLSYSTPTAPLTNQLLQNSNGIQLAGPGYLEVLAGGSLNLGDSAGIITSGNLTDSRLATAGATLVAGAGFGTNSGGGLRQPAFGKFIASYLAPAANDTASSQAQDLIAYMQQLYPGVASTYAAALSAFKSLTPAQQLPFLSEVLSDILSATGIAHTTRGASYAPGFAAINALFPAADAAGNKLSYQGDIDMFYSQIKTEQGGDIHLLDPGGSVIVGVPNPSSALNLIKAQTNPTIAAAANLGLLVLGPGAIEGFADKSFEVNQSRILTLEGGDIILWASYGSIDAGNGAKSASGAPPPVIETSASGTVFVNPVNDVSGSGIGQLLTGPGEVAGLVNLIAPNGDVNAGDAGIRVAGNLNIAAVQVIGAGNISVVGTSTGVPVSEAGALAGALSGANSLGDSSKSVTDQLAQDLGGAANYQQLTEQLLPTFITVKMFCLGVDCETQ